MFELDSFWRVVITIALVILGLLIVVQLMGDPVPPEDEGEQR